MNGSVERRGTAWAALLLVVVVAVAYAPLFWGDILYFRDLARWLYPARHFVRASLARGELPTWNPDQGLGFPVAADPLYGLLYPINALYLVGPLVGAVTWLSFVHLVAGGVGALVLARGLGASAAGAAIAGLAWALSGFTTSCWTLGVILPAITWIPWCGAGFLRLGRVAAAESDWRRLVGAVAWAAVPVGLALLQGEVFFSLFGVAFGIVLAVVGARAIMSAASARRVWSRVAIAGVLAVALGGGIGAATVFPAVLAAKKTERAAPLSRSPAEVWSLHPLRMLELAAPGAIGRPNERYPAAAIVGEPSIAQQPFAYSVYLGASVVALAAAALGRRRRLPAVLLALGAAALVLSLGRHTPLHQVLRTLVPPLAYMRYPEKYFVLVVAFVAPVAAIGATRILSGGAPVWRRNAALMVALAALAAGANLFFGPELAPLVRSGAGSGAASVLLVLGVQLLVPRRPMVASVLLVAVVAVDLGGAVWPMNDWAGPDLLAKVPPAASLVMRERAGMPEAPRPRVYRHRRVDETTGRVVLPGTDTAVRQERRQVDTLIENTVTAYGMATLPGYDAGIPPALAEFWRHGEKAGQGVLRLLAVEYVVLPVKDPGDPVEHRDGLTPLMDPVPGARLYRVHDPLPRVYVAEKATVLPDAQAMDEVFSPDVLNGERVVLGPEPASAALAAGTEGQGAPGQCTIDSFRNDRIELSCQVQRPALAVLVEQWHPGWTATVDGVPSPVLRANVVARAVPVGAGRHRVVLSFTASGLRAGAWISLAALLSACACAFVARRGRAKSAA